MVIVNDKHEVLINWNVNALDEARANKLWQEHVEGLDEQH